jgi:hypothetical protein
MGQVDSTLKYGIYHSYQLMPNDWVYATIFDVQYLSHITAQCVVIKPAGDIAEGRFEVRWIDADGRPIGGTSKKYFTPTRLWKRHTATFEVPENAIKARVHYEGGTQGYHLACAMVEPGEIASAFSFEVASRLVYITNEGAYLGLLNAGQIVTGKMISPDGNAWFDLDKPEIVMKGDVNGKDVIVSLSPDMPFQVKVDGEPLLYISPRTWKIVSSRADINEDGKVDHLDAQIINTYMYYGTEYSDFVMDRANCYRGTPDDAEYINSNDYSFIVDSGANGFQNAHQHREVTLEYSSANEMTAVIDRNMLTLIRDVYPMYIKSPINAVTARSMFTVEYLGNRQYEIKLYDPQGGFQASDEVEIVYFTGAQIRDVGAAPVLNPFPGYSPNPLNPPQP